MKNCKWVIFCAAILICLTLWGRPISVRAKGISLNRTAVTTTLQQRMFRLRVEGISAKRKVVWCSFQKNVAVVDQKGRVTLTGKGNAIIRARVGAKKLYCIVSVVSPKAYAAVQVARKFYNARNMHYSQGNRMGRRSADCSSFCGRCYLAQGMTLGGSKSWCNTAAGMAKYTTKHDMVVSNGKPEVSSKIMLPGDLIFYRGGHNGRYKNIYHVEIFVGYGWKGKHLVGYTMSSITGHYPSILKRDYTSRRKKVTQVSRPAR